MLHPVTFTLPPLSIVIPLYNEADNVLPLVARLHQALTDYAAPWEVWLVDDGSRDGTVAQARKAQQQHGVHIHLVELQRNFGQTAAMQAGFELARGEVIATLDGDLQNDPADIPALVQQLLDEDLDLVVGWRKSRQDAYWSRKVPSWLANRLIAYATGVHLHDYGCSLKVYRAAIIKQIRLYGEMHRFIPAWLATVAPPQRIGERVVNHAPRTRGQSKYGLSRTFRVLFDLLAVLFFLRFRARPGHLFGMLGLFLGVLGSVALGWLAYVKFILGQDIGDRPLLIAGVMCILASAQFLTTGLLAELMARVYFESGQGKPYVIRNMGATQPVADTGWHRHDAA